MQYDEELVIFERMKYLCSAVPVFGSWIKHELETIKSLQRLCRLAIRNATPTEPLKNMLTLDIPVSLINYLTHTSD
jgi:hypothetical protein